MKKYKYISLYIFLGLLIFDTLNLKLSGPGGRGNYLPTEPLSWTEILENLPRSIIAYLIIALSFYLIMKVVVKNNIKFQAKTSKREEDKVYSSPNTHECRICGCYSDDFPWGEDGRSPTFQLCPCCGVQFGKEDLTLESIKEYRDKWRSKGGEWFAKNEKHEEWDMDVQMKNIPDGFR